MTSSFLSAFEGLWRRPATDYKHGVRSYLISLDTNVLLQLYRFTPDARNELLDVLERLDDRLWIPHQVATEYFSRRVDAVKEHLALYTSVPKSLEEARAKAVQELHTFAKRCSMPDTEKMELIKPIDAAFSRTLTTIKRHGESFDLSLENVINADPILASLARILDKKTGQAFEEEEAKRLKEEAERRYKEKVPPGYRDASKTENAHGDFFVWEQLLREAQSRNAPVLFVTNDVKEDWVKKDAGLVVGAHPQLVAEFKDRCAGADFLVTQLGRFLQIAKEEIGASVSASTVAQAENLRDAPRDEMEVFSITPEDYEALTLDLLLDSRNWQDVIRDKSLSRSSIIMARHRRAKTMDLYASLEEAKKSQSMDGMIHIPMRSKDWRAIQAVRRRVTNAHRREEPKSPTQDRPEFARHWHHLANMEKELSELIRDRGRIDVAIHELEQVMVEPSTFGDAEDHSEGEQNFLALAEQRTQIDKRIRDLEGRISHAVEAMEQEARRQ
ncbi:PIN domain-containing protein [Streptomyces sp. NPDC016172]|uniref:PIN domain-containing protein n=1 Tax=Streptomyces sp. NPDC016172 TaxID=3364964 RepID=UPI0036F76119